MHTPFPTAGYLSARPQAPPASDNQIDSLRKGRKGKLSPAQVRMIRASDEPTAFEAARYGVTEDMIRKIRRGTSWHTLDNAA